MIIRATAVAFTLGWIVATFLVVTKIPSPAATLLVVIVPGWIFGGLIARAGWMGVQLGAHGARVRNLLRTQVIEWNQIDGFSVGRTSLLPAVGCINLVDGATVPISGIQPRNVLFFPNDSSASELVAELNRQLVARRTVGAVSVEDGPEVDTGRRH